MRKTLKCTCIVGIAVAGVLGSQRHFSSLEPPWWKKALLPVSESSPTPVSQTSLPSPKTVKPPATRASPRVSQSGSGVTAPTAPKFTANTERVVGNLFKGSLLLVSIPCAGGIILDQMLLPSLPRGLKSSQEAVQEGAMRNLRSYVCMTWAAQKFITMGGVTALLTLLDKPLSTTAMQEMTLCLQHLQSFQPTLIALIQEDAVGKLEKAFRKGWVDACQLEGLHSVYLDLHAARRMHQGGSIDTKTLPLGALKSAARRISDHC